MFLTPSVSLTVVTEGTGDQAILYSTGVNVAFHFCFYPANDHHFLTMVPIDFHFLQELNGCHPTVKFKAAINSFLASVRLAVAVS